jgi:hypothetical protein
MTRRILVSLSLALVLLVSSAQAQQQQVPLDRDSTVYAIDAELREELGLFLEVEGFQEAVLFQVADEAYELVIQSRVDQRTLREERTLTSQEVADLRERVTRRLAETGTRVNLNQEGRYGLLASTTYLSLLEGGLLSAAFGLDGGGAGAMTLMGGAAGFFVPLLATRNTPVTEAEADMTFYGGIQGFVHGLQFYSLASGDDGEGNGRLAAGLSAALGAGESVLAYSIARRNNWSGGHAEMTSSTGLSGNLVGLGLAQGLAASEVSPRLASGLSLAGSVAGALIGHRMGRSDTYTQGDARIYLLSGLQAANVVGSVLVAAEVDGEQGPALAITAAGVAGLAGGGLLVRDRDFTKSQGNIVALGTVAGSLFGGGVAAAAEAEGAGVALLQAVGSLTGSILTYSIFAGEAEQRARRSSAGLTLDLNVAPSMASGSGPRGELVRLADRIVPQVTLRARF